MGATGISQLYEVWTQLKGKAGKRQVPIKDLRIGGAHNLGGTVEPAPLRFLNEDSRSGVQGSKGSEVQSSESGGSGYICKQP